MTSECCFKKLFPQQYCDCTCLPIQIISGKTSYLNKRSQRNLYYLNKQGNVCFTNKMQQVCTVRISYQQVTYYKSIFSDNIPDRNSLLVSLYVIFIL